MHPIYLPGSVGLLVRENFKVEIDSSVFLVKKTMLIVTLHSSLQLSLKSLAPFHTN